MRLGANLAGADATSITKMARLAESLGLDSLWTGEAYGGDAIVPLSIAAAATTRIKLGTAVMQMPARTPAMTAMTAMTLDRMSGHRMLLGLGLSGPQVVEGWHGVPYSAPLRTTEEYVAILRMIFRGDERVIFDGERYSLPYRGEGSTGLGKSIKPGMHSRPDIPIYLAAIGPKNVALATKIADGLLPMLWNPHRAKAAFADALAAADSEFEIIPTVPVVVGDDVQRCRDKVKPLLAMYIGGMGAKDKNFYNTLIRRYGFDEAADVVQEAYLAGRCNEATDLVPDQLVDELALVGPRERIAEQLDAWRSSGIASLTIAGPTRTSMTVLAELLL